MFHITNINAPAWYVHTWNFFSLFAFCPIWMQSEDRFKTNVKIDLSAKVALWYLNAAYYRYFENKMFISNWWYSITIWCCQSLLFSFCTWKKWRIYKLGKSYTEKSITLYNKWWIYYKIHQVVEKQEREIQWLHI